MERLNVIGEIVIGVRNVSMNTTLCDRIGEANPARWIVAGESGLQVIHYLKLLLDQ